MSTESCWEYVLGRSWQVLVVWCAVLVVWCAVLVVWCALYVVWRAVLVIWHAVPTNGMTGWTCVCSQTDGRVALFSRVDGCVFRGYVVSYTSVSLACLSEQHISAL